MKKFFLLMIATIPFHSPILSMNPSAQEASGQENKKKVSVKPKAMIFKLKDGTVVTVTAKAVAMCGQLMDLLQYSPEGYYHLVPNAPINEITFNFDMFNVLDNEVSIFFDILNLVEQKAQSYTDPKTQKCHYLNQDVFNIILSTCKEKNVLETVFLTKMTEFSDFLMCDTLLNGFSRHLVEKSQQLKVEPFYIFDQFSNNSGAMPFLKKHIKRMVLGTKINQYITECTVMDYVILNKGILLPIDNYNMAIQKNLTSLEGLEIIASNCNPSLIRSIDLSDNYLELTDNFTAFNCFPNVTHLYLDHNHLTQLPATIFNNLFQLQELHLTNNQLTELPASLFNGLIKLVVLRINNNQLTKLPATLFNDLVELMELRLSNNQLIQLPASLFNGLIQLTWIDLYNNQLTELPASIFNGLVHLNGLSLKNNQLTELAASLFHGLVQLERLSLNNNKLTQLPATIFNSLIHLQELYLNDNKLTSLPATIFNGLGRLEVLSIKNNALIGLSKDVQRFINRLR